MTAEYSWLLQQLGLYLKNRGIGFNSAEYAEGYCIYASNLSAELGWVGTAQPIKEGNVRLELKFSTATTAVNNVVVAGFFDRDLQLTEFRDVVPGTVWK